MAACVAPPAGLKSREVERLAELDAGTDPEVLLLIEAREEGAVGEPLAPVFEARGVTKVYRMGEVDVAALRPGLPFAWGASPGKSRR